jgi:hypothetical protein
MRRRWWRESGADESGGATGQSSGGGGGGGRLVGMDGLSIFQGSYIGAPSQNPSPCFETPPIALSIQINLYYVLVNMIRIQSDILTAAFSCVPGELASHHFCSPAYRSSGRDLLLRKLRTMLALKVTRSH